MPSLDICFCANKECKLRDKCFKNPDRLKYNEYITVTDFKDNGDTCEYFILKED